MPIHILTFNGGGFSSSTSPVRANMLNLMYRIKGEISNFVNVCGIQETNTDIFCFSPKFGIPTCTDAHVNVVRGPINARRGVATYAEPDTLVVETLEFAHIEATCTIHDYTDFEQKRMNGWPEPTRAYVEE